MDQAESRELRISSSLFQDYFLTFTSLFLQKILFSFSFFFHAAHLFSASLTSIQPPLSFPLVHLSYIFL